MTALVVASVADVAWKAGFGTQRKREIERDFGHVSATRGYVKTSYDETVNTADRGVQRGQVVAVDSVADDSFSGAPVDGWTTTRSKR